MHKGVDSLQMSQTNLLFITFKANKWDFLLSLEPGSNSSMLPISAKGGVTLDRFNRKKCVRVCVFCKICKIPDEIKAETSLPLTKAHSHFLIFFICDNTN